MLAIFGCSVSIEIILLFVSIGIITDSFFYLQYLAFLCNNNIVCYSVLYVSIFRMIVSSKGQAWLFISSVSNLSVYAFTMVNFIQVCLEIGCRC